MAQKHGLKQIVLINGSAAEASANQQLMDQFATRMKPGFKFHLIALKQLPPFDPERAVSGTPAVVEKMRARIARADGVLICTPEYIFSIPSGLKNALEWCVATTVFSDKPTGMITASANGQKAHAELQLILQTLMARTRPEACLLIPGIRGKIDASGQFLDPGLREALQRFTGAFKALLHSAGGPSATP